MLLFALLSHGFHLSFHRLSLLDGLCLLDQILEDLVWVLALMSASEVLMESLRVAVVVSFICFGIPVIALTGELVLPDKIEVRPPTNLSSFSTKFPRTLYGSWP